MASQQQIAQGIAAGKIKIPKPPTPKVQKPPRASPSQQTVAVVTGGTGKTPKVIGVPGRQKFTRKVKAPTGAPAKPVGGQSYTVNNEVYVYRPAGPSGAGWYTLPTTASFTTPASDSAGASPAVTTGSDASGETVQTPPPPPVARNAAWWQGQYTADPRFLRTDPVLRSQQNQVGSTYGLFINRDAQGRTLFKAADGTTGITQGFDDNGKMVYRDATGKVFTPDQLTMDIRRVQRGEDGYLSTGIGSAEAQSEKAQYGIADAAAAAGARRSGMRAVGAANETAALQAALGGLATRAAGEYAGIDKSYADLFTDIYGDLIKDAGALVTPDPAPASAPETPAPAAVPQGTAETGLNIGQALTPKAFGVQLAGIANMGKNATRKTMIKLYRDLARNYALTPAQRARIVKILKNDYGVGL